MGVKRSVINLIRAIVIVLIAFTLGGFLLSLLHGGFSIKPEEMLEVMPVFGLLACGTIGFVLTFKKKKRLILIGAWIMIFSGTCIVIFMICIRGARGIPASLLFSLPLLVGGLIFHFNLRSHAGLGLKPDAND